MLMHKQQRDRTVLQNETHPQAHARYAGQVLIKFKLMLMEQMSRASLHAWALGCETLAKTHALFFADMSFQAWIDFLLAELERKQSIRSTAHSILNL